MQEDEEGCTVRDFLIDKKQYLSQYSIMEFKKTFITAVYYLDSMIDEGRSLSDIYHDTADMKTSSDPKISKMGARLEILLVLLGSPKKINDQMRYHIKMWRQGMLTFQFIDNLTLINSLTNCPMSKSYTGNFSDTYSPGCICDIERFFSDYSAEINVIKQNIQGIFSFKDMFEILRDGITESNCVKCCKIGDILIVFDFMNFFYCEPDSALCSTDQHFDTLCPLLHINKINPITE